MINRIKDCACHTCRAFDRRFGRARRSSQQPTQPIPFETLGDIDRRWREERAREAR